jgi:CheY-like chemotaxis protein
VPFFAASEAPTRPESAKFPVFSQLATVSILGTDEPDVANLFGQRFPREAREGTYAVHFATSGEAALQRLAEGSSPP